MPETKQRRKQPSKQVRQEAERAAYLRAMRRRNRRVTIVAVISAIGIGTIGVLSFVEPADDPPEVAAGDSTTSTAPATTVDPSLGTCPKPDGTSARQMHWPQPPPVCIAPTMTYEARVETDVGTFMIELDNRNAPQTVNNFVFLARYHFYDGLTFHKAKPGFVIQSGDPPDKGVTNAGYFFNDENLPPAGQGYVAGDLIMAKDKPNTNGSQFLIISGPEGETLPPQYSRFGRVTGGFDVVRRIEADGCVGECQDLAPDKVHVIRRLTIIEK